VSVNAVTAKPMNRIWCSFLSCSGTTVDLIFSPDGGACQQE
jgi:hypothetical protein